MKIEDKILLNEIQKQNREVFKALFHEYYPHLIKYTEGFIFDKTACQDIVQNLFIYFGKIVINLKSQIQSKHIYISR